MDHKGGQTLLIPLLTVSHIRGLLFPDFTLDFFWRPLRIAWIRRNTTAESPVVTPMERNVAITVFGDTEETEENTTAEVDNTLQISLIPKAMVERLRVSYEYEPSRYGPITDSRGRTHQPIGQTRLRWHKTGKPKSHPHVFHIVDGLTHSVVLGSTIMPEVRAADVGTLGLSNQTDGKICFHYHDLNLAVL